MVIWPIAVGDITMRLLKIRLSPEVPGISELKAIGAMGMAVMTKKLYEGRPSGQQFLDNQRDIVYQR